MDIAPGPNNPVAGIKRTSLRDAFAESRGTKPHEALDIPAPRGTPVVANLR